VHVLFTGCILFHFFFIEILKFGGLEVTATGSHLRLLNRYLLSGNSISHSSEKNALFVDTISGNKNKWRKLVGKNRLNYLQRIFLNCDSLGKRET
jgi:hypothetical protein